MAAGSDCEPVEDVTIALEGRQDGRGGGGGGERKGGKGEERRKGGREGVREGE